MKDIREAYVDEILLENIMNDKYERFFVKKSPRPLSYEVQDQEYKIKFPDFITSGDAIRVCEYLNHMEKNKEATLKLITDKIKETEEVLANGVRLGMPTGAIHAEIDLLETINKELHEIWGVEYVFWIRIRRIQWF